MSKYAQGAEPAWYGKKLARDRGLLCRAVWFERRLFLGMTLEEALTRMRTALGVPIRARERTDGYLFELRDERYFFATNETARHYVMHDDVEWLEEYGEPVELTPGQRIYLKRRGVW